MTSGQQTPTTQFAQTESRMSTKRQPRRILPVEALLTRVRSILPQSLDQVPLHRRAHSIQQYATTAEQGRAL